MRREVFIVLGGFAALLITAEGLRAQPDRQPDKPPAQPERQGQEGRRRPPERPRPMGEDEDRPLGGDRSVRLRLMLRLENEIARLDDRREHLRAALKSLEEGESPERVRERAHLGPEGPVRPGMVGPDVPKPTREEIESFVREQLPSFWGRYEETLEKHPRMARTFFERAEKRLGELYRVWKADPGLGELHIEEFRCGMEIVEIKRELAAVIRRGEFEKPEGQRLRRQLREVIGELFDTQEKLHSRELTRLEEQVAKLREEQEHRRADRQRYIEEQESKILQPLPSRDKR